WSSAVWYQNQSTRSLDTAAFQEQFWASDLNGQFNPQDLCYNWCLHVAEVLERTTRTISKDHPGKILVSGGGAAHPVLMSSMQQKSNLLLIKAEPMVQDFKEALIFGLLGLLHHLNLPNVLGHSTGASANHRSGARVG
ncbi:MAG: hypothetical protein FJ343_05810, partial [Sphingomonadales bacterium]|nr:hypothetical protein [Sphingomonadales bacterium]